MRETTPRLPSTTCCTVARDDKATARPANTDVTPAECVVDHGFIRLGNVEFVMGAEDTDGFAGDGEGPRRRVCCRDYAIAPRTVSNAEFRRFVRATGYVTDAERFGWSFVFEYLLPDSLRAEPVRVAAGIPWWRRVEGASWSTPEGPGTDVTDRMDHPVVHVSWRDAAAYCHWSRTRLPTEAEWEFAARGGLHGGRYAWGDELHADGIHHCNIWQGRFPDHNTVDDGFFGTAPTDAFEANGFGLFNVCGNVWEWCADWFSPNYHRVTRAVDPLYMIPTGSRSMRGGSFLCHHSYCNRYRVAARSSNTPDSSTSHCGFRVVGDFPTR